MSDASYYRFRNIVTEIRDCEDVVDQFLNGVTDDGQPLPDQELSAVKQLVGCCIDIVTLVADGAGVRVDLGDVRDSIESVLREANGAPLEARHDLQAERLLLSNNAR